MRMGRQIRDLQLAASQPLGFLVQYFTTALASLGVAFYSSWKLALVILSTLPLAAIALSFISARMQPAIDAQSHQLALASKHANTAITAINTVKAFNGQDNEVWQYSQIVKLAARCYITQAHNNALQIAMVRVVTLGMFVQGFWYGNTLLNEGKSPGQILTCFWSCLMATQS